MRDRSPPPASPGEPPAAVRGLKFTLELLAIMGAMGAQSVAVIWWAAGMDHRLASVEHVIAPLSDGTMRDTLSRVDERTASMQRRADRKAALRTYLYSLIYLAVLFGAMVADARL